MADDVPTVRDGGARRPRTEDERAPAAVTAATASAFDPPADRFVARGELGRGGMGRVIDAFDRALGRPVAVKSILSTAPADLVRFEREAQITARLEHPGIVPIHDAGRDADGTPYYVMRKVDGRPLDQLVEGLDLDARLALVPNVLAACDAVAYAHARGVIHRDIKPPNILVGPFGETLVIDWGIARASADGPDAAHSAAMPAVDEQLTRAGMVAGTPGFMSPEQARGELVDPRADVYALGATLFFVLSGHLLYSTASATEMIELAGADRALAWDRLPAGVPADLQTILRTALATQARARYADAGALAADLRRFVAGKLVAAHRYGFAEQVRRFAQRHRAAIGVAVLALVVIAGGTGFALHRIVAERDAARAARTIAVAERAAAQDRSDATLVAHAHGLAITDPSRTIALLRTLRPESAHWRAVAIAASAAAARGIPHGFAFPARVRQWALSPDGARVAVRTADDSRITVIDLATRHRTTLPIAPGAELRWLDANQLCNVVESTVQLHDLRSNTTTTLDVGPDPWDLRSVGRGTALILRATGELYVIDASTRQLGAPVERGVADAHSLYEGGYVLRRGGAVELVRAGERRSLQLPWSAAEHPNLVVQAGSVLVTSRSQACAFDPVMPMKPASCAPVPRASVVAHGAIVSVDTVGVRFDRGGHTSWRTGPVETVVASAAGFVATLRDGQLWAYTGGSWFDIGARPLAFQRAALTADARYVVASTANELFVFAVPNRYRERIPLEDLDQLAALHEGSAYVVNMLAGLISVDLATQVRRVVSPDVMTHVWHPLHSPWLTAQLLRGGAALVQLQTGERIELVPDEVRVDTSGALSIIDLRDGRWWELAAGGRSLRGALPAQPILVQGGGEAVAAAYADGRVCRATARSGTACTAIGSAAKLLVVDRTGTAWLVAGTSVWRWDGGLLLRFTTPQELSDLLVTDHYVVGVATSALYAFRGSSMQPLPVATTDPLRVLGEDQLVALHAGTLSVIDLPTGLAYTLGDSLAVSRTVVTADRRILTIAHQQGRASWLGVHDLEVPLERDALRRWLTEVTNMTPVPGSDVVAWP